MAKYNVTATPRDGNAYSIAAAVIRAMKSEGATKEETTAYWEEATAGDYGNLLRVSLDYVNLDNDDFDIRDGLEL
tara:strand:+ start:808 stop:1032 length:225 start_codon:yes stop_codon:yes gene_type:complete